MSSSGYAPSSISSHVSALSFAHKINGCPDPTEGFIVKKLKEGAKRMNPRVDSRLPITQSILRQIIHTLPSVCNSQFEVVLFRAAFLLAFFGFLRVSEFTCRSKKDQKCSGLGSR
jgi:hypothetical protein